MLGAFQENKFEWESAIAKLTKYGPQVEIKLFCYFFIIIRVAEFPPLSQKKRKILI